MKLTSSPKFRFRDVWFIQINCLEFDDKNEFTSMNKLPERYRIRFLYESDNFFWNLSVIDEHMIWGGWIFDIVFLFYLLTLRTCPNLFNLYLK